MTPSAAPAPIPLTVIGGFLGAGKTTLVNAVLNHVSGRRLAVLVNDFGALSIDATLVSARSARTIALANGCVCCTLVNGLVQALIDVLALDPLPDHVLVEASGVADPRRIAQIARADRAFAQDATIVLAAADQIRALAADRYVGDTVLRQLVGADLIVLNKIDLVRAGDADAVCAWLREVAPSTRIMRATHASLPCDVVLGAGASAIVGGDTSRSVHVPHHGAMFATRMLRCEQPVSEAKLRAALAALPDAVLRAKGFVRFDAAPERVQLVQVVGGRWSITPALLDAHVTPMLVIVGTAALQPDDVGDLARLLEGGQ